MEQKLLLAIVESLNPHSVAFVCSCRNSVSGITNSVKPQSKQEKKLRKNPDDRFVQTREPGKMNSDSPLKVR
jgi:hypothetical protein